MGGQGLGPFFKPTPINKPVAKESFNFDYAFGKESIQEAGESYSEIQIGRGVNLAEDVEEIIFLEDRMELQPYKTMFRDMGIQVRSPTLNVEFTRYASKESSDFLDELLSNVNPLDQIEDLVDQIGLEEINDLKVLHGLLVGIVKPGDLGPRKLKGRIKKAVARFFAVRLTEYEVIAQQGDARFFVLTHGDGKSADSWGRVVDVGTGTVGDKIPANFALKTGWWKRVTSHDKVQDAIDLVKEAHAEKP